MKNLKLEKIEKAQVNRKVIWNRECRERTTGKIHRFDRRVLDWTSTTASNKVGLEDVMLVVCIGSKNINGS